MSDDPTKQTPPTQPTIETVLERINALGERLSGEIHALDEKLSGEIQELKTEVKLMNRKFEVVTAEWLELKARSREAEARLDELEGKAS